MRAGSTFTSNVSRVVAAAVVLVLAAAVPTALAGDGDRTPVLATAVAALVVGSVVGWLLARSAPARRADDGFVDPDTGMYNARFFVLETDVELARARRYGRLFSAVLLDLPVAPFLALGRRARATALQELGRQLTSGVRTTDRVVVTSDHSSYRIAVVLPETPGEGARIFAQRLADRVGALLLSYNAAVPPLTPVVVTVPTEEMKFAALREEFLGVARRR